MSHRVRFELDEIEEYIRCPMKHLYGYRYGIIKKRESISSIEEEIQKNTVLDIALCIMQDKHLSDPELFGIYDKRVLQSLSDRDIKIEDFSSNLSKGRLSARSVYQYLNKFVVKGVALPFEVTIESVHTKQRITVTDQLDIVVAKRAGKVPLYNMKCIVLGTIDNIPTNVIGASPKLVSTRLAAEIFVQQIPNASKRKPELVYYNIEKNKEFKTEDVRKHSKMGAEHCIISITNLINQGVYFPNHNKQCSRCPFRSLCNTKHAANPRTVMVDVPKSMRMTKRIEGEDEWLTSQSLQECDLDSKSLQET